MYNLKNTNKFKEFDSLNSPPNTICSHVMQIIFAMVLLMSPALSNSTRATHSSNSYSSAVDIRNTTTKIIDITLTTRRITTDYFNT
jgi:hypothetical protein